jgi:CRISP-associated protein Cas1
LQCRRPFVLFQHRRTDIQSHYLKPSGNNGLDQSSSIAQTILKSTESLSLFKPYETVLLEKARPHFLGIEGSIARGSRKIIEAVLENPTLFDGRNRRPATDSFNAALNYAYGMLYNVVEQACFATGLDPQ